MADPLPPSGQTPELSLGGLSLLYDKDHQAADFLRKYQPLDDLIAQVDHAISTENSKSSSVGGWSRIGLPRPNYPPAPPPRINQLYWPTGAVRWARGYFLASSTVAVALASKCGTALPFVATVNGITITADMYCLPPRPVSCVSGGYDTLFLIPIVDERYWWQFRNYGDMGKPTLTSWSALITHLGARLGVSIVPGTIASAYLKPDEEEYTRRYDNAAYLLDAAAHSLGCRIVRQFDGTVFLMDWDLSLEQIASNISSLTPWWQIAGDDFDNKPVPASVTVAFPKLNCWIPSCDREFYTYSIANTTQKCSVGSSIKTIHSTAWAKFSDSATPLNNAELSTLATQIATDYYKSFDAYYDRTFDGLKDWRLTGYDDHLLFSFGTEDEEKILTARTSVDIDDAEPVASTELDCTYQAGYFTRAQAMPGNFGVDEMLHQNVEPKLPLGIIPMVIKEGEILLPGGNCLAYMLTWNGADWVKDGSCNHVVYDPYFRNCLFGKEKFYARASCENDHLEIVGENGLKKLGYTQEAILAGDASGSVLLLAGSLQSYGVGDCLTVQSGPVVTACNPAGAAALPAQRYVFLHYHPDCFKWLILSSGSASNFAEAIAATDHCPDDPGGSGSGAEQVVTVTNAIYLPDCESFEPNKVVNPRNHRWPAGSKLLLIRKQCLGGSGSGDNSDEEWQVFDVELQKQCVNIGLADRPSCLVAAFLFAGMEFCPADQPTSACAIVDYSDCSGALPACDTSWTFVVASCCDAGGSGSGSGG